MITPTIKHAKEVIRLVNFGLTKGLGEPKEGKMCIEAVICKVFNLPHGDNPECVGEEVRKAKIALNDCRWSSNLVRANGMKKLAIAQLGSNTLNQEKFKQKLKLETAKKILPYLIQKNYEDTKDDRLLKYKKKFEKLEVLDDKLWKEFYNYYYNHYYYYYYYYYNHYYYNYNNYDNYYYGDEFLLLMADTILQVLIDMKSPGCKWLYLCE